MLLTGGQSVDLALLLTDHVQQTVLYRSAFAILSCSWKLLAYHLALLFVLEFLMQLAQTWCALMVRAMRPWASTTGRWTLLHLTRRRYSWVVEVKVHTNAGPTSCPFDVPPHATGGSSALIFVLNASIHCRCGSKRVR